MGYGSWKPYVPVAKRRAEAQKRIDKARKSGKTVNPVVIEGRSIAKTFWGKAWCDNLEAYSDYANRLPRGRTYTRNGSILDLAIEPGKVQGQVMGSSLYEIEIRITALPKERWASLVRECTGSIASLVELLQGKFSKGVMERFCHPQSGLFPAPKEISLDCSCPDWATMCKHVAAVLYGVGARLDSDPELLFTLRQVDPSDLITEAVRVPVETEKAPSGGRMLEDDSLEELFGIEMAVASSHDPKPKPQTSGRKSPTPKTEKRKTPDRGKKATTQKIASPPLQPKPQSSGRKSPTSKTEKSKTPAKGSKTEKRSKEKKTAPPAASKPRKPIGTIPD